MNHLGNSNLNFHIGSVDITEDLTVQGDLDVKGSINITGDIDVGSLTVGGFKFITVKDDFPAPVGGVITLLDNNTYYINGTIDLTGDRLVGGANTTLLGNSSENSIITSTGLGVGVALFTTAETTPIRNIAFKDVDTCFDISDVGTSAYDWNGVNIVNVPNIGTVDNVSNFIFINGAILNSSNWTFSGTIGTIGFDGSIFVSDNNTSSLFILDSTLIVTRRFRIIYSALVVLPNDIGITLDPLATIPNESLILDTVNFSSSGTFLDGVTSQSNTALFINSVGIDNTFVNGQVYMNNNATVTTISDTTTFVKVLGTTTASVDNSKVVTSDNRITCDATISRKYLIQCNLSFTTGNNKVCEFGFYDSKLADVRLPSRTKSTSSGSGRAENVSFSCVVDFVQNDYIEIHCRNTTNTDNITVTDLNVVMTQL